MEELNKINPNAWRKMQRQAIRAQFLGESRLSYIPGEEFVIKAKFGSVLRQKTYDMTWEYDKLTGTHNYTLISVSMIAVFTAIVNILSGNEYFAFDAKLKKFVYEKNHIPVTKFYQNSLASFVKTAEKFGMEFTTDMLTAMADIVHRVILSEIKRGNFFIDIEEKTKTDEKYPQDMRHWTEDAKWIIRCKALDLLRAGKTRQEVAKLLGIDWTTVDAIYKKWKNKPHLPYADLRGKKTGPKGIPDKVLSATVRTALFDALEAEPSQSDIYFSSTWTGQAIQVYLKEKHNLDVKLSYIYYFLARYCVTFKFSARKDPKQDAVAKLQFMTKEYARICREAFLEGREIVFCDETGCKRDHHKRGYALRGKRATINYSTSAGHIEISECVFLSIEGELNAYTIDKSLTGEKFVKLLTRFHNENPNRKITLILDNAKCHKCAVVDKWLEQLKENNDDFIKMEWLPAYCPELNPVEYFNNDFKAYLRSRCSKNKSEALCHLDDYYFKYYRWVTLEERRKRILSFFMGEGCAYSLLVYLEVKNAMEQEKLA